MNHIFVKDSMFSQTLPNSDQHFHLQGFFCGSIHGLHLCDNFDAFNINIEDFICKNSKKITNNYPSISYIKGQIFETELNLTFHRSIETTAMSSTK